MSELCQDWYHGAILIAGDDPVDTRPSESRVARGGSFRRKIAEIKLCVAWTCNPETGERDVGFRCVWDAR